MKSVAILISVFWVYVLFDDATIQDPDLFAIPVKGKFGFIDQGGQIVIEPQFENAEEFSEGLCAVRIDGAYGFIDTGGTMKISPVFDYATAFKEGLALVFLKGKPLFIDRSGKIVIEKGYMEMTPFRDGLSYVTTYSSKKGIINQSGDLIIDTLYSYIGPFVDSLAIVNGLGHRKKRADGGREDRHEVSIINRSGKQLVPYGKFEDISHNSEGFFVVSWPIKKKGNVSLDGFMNAAGEITYTMPRDDGSWIESGVHNGIARVSLPLKSKKNSDREFYEAYITPYGKVIYDDASVDSGEDFSENFALVTTKVRGYYKVLLINRRGEIIAKDKFTYTTGGFKNGLALVRTNDGWGVIDTTGTFVLNPRFKNVYQNRIIDGLIFFQDESENGDFPRYGISDLRGNIITEPLFQFFDGGFKNGLLKVWIDDKMAYINRSGRIVWKEEAWEPDEPQPLNIDFMNRGYFYANYNNTGHGNSSNTSLPEKVTMLNSFEGASLTVVVNPDMEFNWSKDVKGMIVFVANTTGDTINFNAQDSRLYMKAQARDLDGNWKDIEYLPNSWCGNSYHHVELPANHYWTFVMPQYEGSIPTKMRIVLTYVDPTDKPKPKTDKESLLDWGFRDKRELVVYSNEFEGSVNAGQFWRRLEYHPAGLMDPYNE